VLGGHESALGWDVLELAPGYEFLFKDGATGGYRTFLAWDPTTRTGVVVLSNAASSAGVADIGLHVLNPEIPLESARALAPPKRRVAITIDPALLPRYVGSYRIAKDDVLTITADGHRLFEQRTGELRCEIFPESRRSFFCRLFDEQVAFESDSRGVATALTFTQNGRAMHARRVR
jgi:hypothetical protein